MRQITSTFFLVLVLSVGAVSQTIYRPSNIDLTLRLKSLREKCLKLDNDKQIIEYNKEFKDEVREAIDLNLEFETDS